MRSILRNELRWALPLAALGIVIHLIVLVDIGAGDVWFLPGLDKYGMNALGLFAVAASLVGFAAAWGDDLLRTREYLRHRPVSARALFWGRHLAGMGVVFALVFLPPPLHLLATYLFGADARLVDPTRWEIWAAHGVAAFLFYAIAAFAGSVCRTLLGGLALTAMGSASAAGVLVTVIGKYPRAGTLAALLIPALTVPWLLLAAARAWAEGRDPDRPWRSATWRIAAPIAVMIAGLAGTLGLSSWYIGLGKLLLEHYPRVIWNGSDFALRRHDTGDHHDHFVDDQHRLGPVVSAGYITAWNPRWGLAGTEDPTGDGAFPQGGHSFRGTVYRRVSFTINDDFLTGFLASDGYLHLYRRARYDGEADDQPWYRRLGKGRDNAPFAPGDRVMESSGDEVGVIDAADGSLWFLQAKEAGPTFVRYQLPGGDRFVSTARPEGAAARSPYLRFGQPLVLHGERASYLLENQQLRPLPEAHRDRKDVVRPEAEVTLRGPASFDVTVTIPGGAAEFRHEYRPRWWPERLLAGLMPVATLARPPAIAAASWVVCRVAMPARPFAVQYHLLDLPTLLGGRWALFGNAALTLLLAALTVRRSRRLGIFGGRGVFWTGAVLLVGVPAFLCYRLVETDRAWRPVPRAAEQPAGARLLFFKPTA